MTVWHLVFSILIGTSLLTTAIVLAVIGNILGAIFTAILWVGYSNNANARVAYHQRQGTLPHQKADPFEQLMRQATQHRNAR